MARQDGRHFPDDIFKCIFLNQNARISLKISLKFVPKVRINNIPALVQIMAWRRSGDKPLSEPMLDDLLAHICVTRPQWVKLWINFIIFPVPEWSESPENSSWNGLYFFRPLYISISKDGSEKVFKGPTIWEVDFIGANNLITINNWFPKINDIPFVRKCLCMSLKCTLLL